MLLFTMHKQINKINIKTINLNYQSHNKIKNMNYLIDHILYHIFKIILSIPLKHGSTNIKIYQQN